MKCAISHSISWRNEAGRSLPLTAQLGCHRKLCALLNVEGFYNGLISFLDKMVEEAFVKANHHSRLGRGLPNNCRDVMRHSGG
ncbi:MULTISPECIES: LOG family protein [unclassified Pseudomonas]|uniref:LOG family protein n=1 Tax=unclassified Pseudomonas TaxID=196821 RepID=UPI002E8082F3|nr:MULTISPECIES: LOG family protein [unclassified Pseudomonas]